MRERLEQALAIFILVVLSEAPVMTLLKIMPPESVSPIAQALYFLTYGLALIGCVLRRPWGLLLRPSGLALTVFIALVFASITWSIEPELTLRRAVAQAGTLLGALYLASFGWRDVVRLVAWALLGMAGASAVLALAPPHLGVMQEIHVGAWSGLWGEKNRYAATMALGVVACFAASFHSPTPRRWQAAAAALVVMVVLAKSATSFLAVLLAGAVALTLFAWRRGPIAAVLTALGALAAATAGMILALVAPEVVTNLAGREANFTGRTGIWESVLYRVAERPWTGYGYSAFWEAPDGPSGWIENEIGFKAETAHNAWLETILQLGLVGVALIGVLIALSIVRSITIASRSAFAYFTLPVLAMLLLISLTESIFPAPNYLPWLLLAAIALALERRIKPASP
jgi:O-antigen ligase